MGRPIDEKEFAILICTHRNPYQFYNELPTGEQSMPGECECCDTPVWFTQRCLDGAKVEAKKEGLGVAKVCYTCAVSLSASSEDGPELHTVDNSTWEKANLEAVRNQFLADVQIEKATKEAPE